MAQGLEAGRRRNGMNASCILESRYAGFRTDFAIYETYIMQQHSATVFCLVAGSCVNAVMLPDTQSSINPLETI